LAYAIRLQRARVNTMHTIFTILTCASIFGATKEKPRRRQHPAWGFLNRDARHYIFSLLEPHHWLQAAESPGGLDGPDEKKRRRTLSSKIEPENPVWATRIVKTATRLEELDRGISDTDRRLKIIDADEKDLRHRLNKIPKRREETMQSLEKAKEERKKTLTELADHVTKIK
jgi:hypothetical protein